MLTLHLIFPSLNIKSFRLLLSHISRHSFYSHFVKFDWVRDPSESLEKYPAFVGHSTVRWTIDRNGCTLSEIRCTIEADCWTIRGFRWTFHRSLHNRRKWLHIIGYSLHNRSKPLQTSYSPHHIKLTHTFVKFKKRPAEASLS